MSNYLPSFSAPSSRPTSPVGSPSATRPTSFFANSRANSTYHASRRNSETNPSRAHSIEEVSDPEATDESKEEEKPRSRAGRVVGGKYIDSSNEDVDPDCGPITTVDIDMPLTLTDIITEKGKEYIVLGFAVGDPENPFNWNPWRKRAISTMLNMMTLFIGLATTAYSSGINSMVADLGASNIQGQLGLFTFNISCAIAPMVLAPFCELVGRKVVYASSFLCFSLLFIGLALAKNIETIIGLRLLLGLFGCVGTILVGGTFDDMYEPHQRSRPMAMFSFVAIFGTVAAPIYAGFIDESIGWRWIQGIQGLANVPLLIVIFLFFPETRGGVTLHKRAKALRKATGDERYVSASDILTPSLQSMLKASSVKAIHMLVTEPVVFAFGLWIAFCWAVVFLFLSVIPITFNENHGWSEGVSGLPYISLCIGTTLGWLAHHLQMRKFDRLVKDPHVHVTPEARLYGAMFGAVFLPIGLFIYSFTQYSFLSWVGPAIGLAPIAFGVYFVFESTYSYTADCYGTSSSSAIAGQGLMRNTLGAVTPLFANAFFNNVGSQYAGLILALFGTVLSLIPFVMFKYGHELRARSHLTIEIK